jgi:poly(beta-D-mannuronate) lyase
MRVSSDVNAITLSSFYADDYMYFKAGLYNQNKTGTSYPDFASVTFKAIDVSH